MKTKLLIFIAAFLILSFKIVPLANAQWNCYFDDSCYHGGYAGYYCESFYMGRSCDGIEDVAGWSCSEDCGVCGYTCATPTPTPPPTPDCNTGVSCGGCSASPHYCSSNDGTSSCDYTTYSGGGDCNEVWAYNNSCTVNNCVYPETCISQSCVSSTPTPSPSSSPSPSPSPSPTPTPSPYSSPTPTPSPSPSPSPTPGPTSTSTIIGKGRDAYALEIDSNLNVSGYIGNSPSSSTQITKAWHHVVMTYDGANIKIYVDGILEVTTPMTGPIGTNTAALVMGSGMNGKLNDMRVYNRALSQAEVTAWHDEYAPNLQISNLQKGLIGWWRMDNNAKDSTNYANNGTVTGATLTTDRKGQSNRAYSFDGASNHILVGNAGSGIETISFWMKPSATTSEKIINIDGTRQIELNSSSDIVATGFPGATVYIDGSSASANISDTNWHFVTIVDATGVSPSTLDLGAVSTDYFSGKLDDVRIYNRALYPTEVTALYDSY